MDVLNDMAASSFHKELKNFRSQNPDSRWIYDPEVEGVVGLVLGDGPNSPAAVVVYTQSNDFEVNDDLI